MILVVTNADDDHAELVLHELGVLGAEAIRFDTEAYPTRARVEVEVSGGRLGVSLGLGEREVDGGEIEAVWYRHPRRPEAGHEIDPAARTMVESELGALLDGALLALECHWVNHPSANELARHKLLQLRLACRLGFDVPETLVSMDAGRIRARHREWGGEMVAKLVGGQVVPARGEQDYVIFTAAVPQHALVDDAALSAAPAIYQRRVPKAHELRVTVVGERAFGVRIDSQAHADTAVDWRAGETARAPQRPVELDPGLVRGCVELNRRLGLRFSGIDLIVTPEARTVFLEINANAQWSWLQHELGLPIARAIADELIAGAGAAGTRAEGWP